LEQLGEGGMGVVYVAEDTRLGRRAALKFLPRDLTSDDDARKRFVHEAQAASSLDNQNICTVYEIDEADDGSTFIAMAYYEGENLKKVIAGQPMTVENALDVAMQIARGLEKAHAKGIIHRDVKPANVIITEDGVVKIVDFGLAKLAGRTQITRTGAVLGTAAYMAPEQLRGEEVDHRVDIWGLGVVLYEMVTGRVPFYGEYEQAIYYKIVNDEPDLSEFPSRLAPFVEKCLQKDAANRFGSMTDVVYELSALRAGLVKPTTAAPIRSSIVRKWARAAAALLGIIILAASLFSPANRSALFGLIGINTLPESRHLAVLPFRNVSGDAAGAAYCSGLMETLSSKLSQFEQFAGEQFWVVPASDVLSRSVRSAEEARRVFGANLVFDGSLNRSSEGSRLTLNLIDTATRRVLASEVLDYTSGNQIALQDAAVTLAANMLQMQMPSKADRMLTAGGTSVPGAEDFYLQGRGYLNDYQKAENIDTAIGLFERALEEDSTYGLAHAGLAEAYWRKYTGSNDAQWVEKAVYHGDRALDLDEMLAPAHVMLGTTHFEMGRYEAALEAFQHALEIDPVSVEAYRGRARAYEAQGRLEDAEETLKNAISLRPSYWAGYNALGAFYRRQGRYDEAIEQFKIVTALTPENAWGFQNLGSVYFALGREAEAVEMFEQSLHIQPDYRVFSNLATYYFYKGEYATAAQMYEKALEMEELDYKVWGYLAESYYWAPDMREKAAPHFRRAIEMAQKLLALNPNDPDVLWRLASYYARTGERAEALSTLLHLESLQPSALEILFGMGDAYETLGEREKALHWIGEAVSKGYTLAEIERAPSLRALRSDPRYEDIRNLQ
jgi:serine/threonine-protein kinase